MDYVDSLIEEFLDEEEPVIEKQKRKLSKEAEEFLAEGDNEQYRAQIELFEGNYNYPSELINNNELKEDVLEDLFLWCPETEIEYGDDYVGVTDSHTFSDYSAEQEVVKYHYAAVTSDDGINNDYFEDTPYVKLCVELDLRDTIELEGEMIPGSYYDGSRFQLPDEYKTMEVEIGAYVEVSGLIDCHGRIATDFEGDIDSSDIERV